MPIRPDRIVPLIIAVALFMENMDSTVIATALPAIATDIGSNPLALKLAITSYLLSLAIFIPASGWTADRFGARTVFRAAIAVFVLGSIGCALSSSLTDFVIARIVQGMGGAMMTPVGRMVLVRSISKRELVSAMAWVTTPALIGPVLGPPVGGFITTYANWRWIFFLNVPIGILGMALVSLFIENYQTEKSPPLDWLGFLLSGFALAGLVYGLDLIGRSTDGPVVIGAILCASLLVGALAVLHFRRQPHPLIDLSLLRVPTYAASVVGGSIFRIGAGAVPFLLPLMLQIGFGWSAFASGLLTCASALGAFTMKMTARPILRGLGFRRVLIGNGIVSGLAIMLCALFQPTTPYVLILAALLFSGFFRSLQYTSLNTVAYADIGAARMSAASSAASMMQQLTNGLGVAVAALLLQLTRQWGGTATLIPADFHIAFVVTALISLSSVLFYRNLDPAAGAEVSGHRRGKKLDVEPGSA